MRGDEARVVAVFCRYLTSLGWTSQREVDFVEVKSTEPAQERQPLSTASTQHEGGAGFRS